ncbi:uncharacterized protein LOC120356575 [Nilaparvata lugens]|uniref:uncharacterized protein LOC120356575 n=1 Tax=Nilaparvata lugens TaxID=108931 RepID=UPI00193E52CF|nr:uncharacterized protein LOC120356575 [Nilaparvata lugens]
MNVKKRLWKDIHQLSMESSATTVMKIWTGEFGMRQLSTYQAVTGPITWRKQTTISDVPSTYLSEDVKDYMNVKKRLWKDIHQLSMESSATTVMKIWTGEFGMRYLVFILF